MQSGEQVSLVRRMSVEAVELAPNTQSGSNCGRFLRISLTFERNIDNTDSFMYTILPSVSPP